jgi:toxin-antitoxin system PIN domain toxin
VILPDVNRLVHAYNSDSAVHDGARARWEGLLNGTDTVGLAWAGILGFVRITPHRQILATPMPVARSVGHARAWVDRPQVVVLEPGSRHADLVFGLLESLGTAGNLTTDGHLAALASEHQAELHSTDADFARFPGLRWRNPLG